MNVLKFAAALAVNIVFAIGNILIIAVALPALIVAKSIDEAKDSCER
ncbi:hypothetical protein [Nitratifractor sp.]